MTPQHVYVPIVKGKVNDVKALGKLSSEVRGLVKPLIETMPVDCETQTIDRHVYQFVKRVIKHCPLGSAFVDFYGLRPEDSFEDGQNATLAGFTQKIVTCNTNSYKKFNKNNEV